MKLNNKIIIVKTKAFTLFEIIITIILISIIYTFAISSFTNKTNKNINDISLVNLKQKLLKYDFNDNITVKCIKSDYSCFVFIDNIIVDEKIGNLFKSKPTVYNYTKDYKQIEYLPLELEQLESYDVVFQYSCKQNWKCSELIVEFDDLVYVFNDIKNKPKVFKYLGDVDIYFDNKIQEVKNAF
jgi:competence protein ComGC